MNKRWLVAGGAVALGAGAFFLWRDRSPASAMTKQQRSAQLAMDIQRNAPEAPADPLAPHPGTKFVRPVPKFNPKNGSYEMPMIDAVPDPEGEAREQFGYKAHRLKLNLGDEAARCYTGPDGKEEIRVGYSMIVENEVLRADDVRVLENSFSDPALTACVVNAIRDMRTLVEKMPNMRQDTEFIMSAHDFFVRNHQDQSNVKGHNDDTMTEVDRPTVVPLPPPPSK